jgi:hypothetical protein
MPTSVRLDVRTEKTLERLARERGTSKSAVLREAVDALARRSSGKRRNGSVFAKFRHVIGCASSGRGDLSTRTGEGFRRILEQRKRR